jgi:prepilin-type N-terminal cleavage/methylation domain-containing protein
MVKQRICTRRRLQHTSQAGVTLVELLVTMVIAGMVTSSTFLFFAGQKQVYETQTKLLNIQQNLWGAMETVTRNLRAAGTGMVGCVRPDSDGTGVDNGDPPPVSLVGTTPPQTGLRAFVDGVAFPNTAGLYTSGATNRIAPLWIQNGLNGAPDSVIVAYGAGTSGNFVDAAMASTMPMGTPVTNVTVALGLGVVFRQDEFIVLVDSTGVPVSGNFDRGCTLFQIVRLTAGSDLLDITSTGSKWNPTSNLAPMVPFAYDPANSGVRNFGQLNWVRFAINNTGNQPNLEMTRLDANLPPQVLAEGVEDMQIAYACDLFTTAPGTPPDGSLSESSPPSITDEWTYNATGDVPPINGCNRPQGIRITLLARSVFPDENLNGIPGNRKAAIEDGVAGPVDLFRHRSISTTVFPRN